MIGMARSFSMVVFSSWFNSENVKSHHTMMLIIDVSSIGIILW